MINNEGISFEEKVSKNKRFLYLVSDVVRRFRCLGLNFYYRIESYRQLF